MTNSYEKSRIEELEAKVYFELRLTADESTELDRLIAQVNHRLDMPSRHYVPGPKD